MARRLFGRREDGPAHQLRRDVANVPFWYHGIDLGHGVVTPGEKSAELLAGEWETLQVPDLRGKSVLDIGAWDGYFSYEAERRGASHVVALDHFVWSVDFAVARDHIARRRADGAEPEPLEQVPSVWKPAELPGKAGFDLAHRVLSSQVESRVEDFMEMNLDDLGQFDVVFYLGVLYHIRNPLAALERVFQVTKEVAIIETQAMVVPGFEEAALWEFFPGAELASDPSNWWRPNLKALLALCQAAGFGRVEVTSGGLPADGLEPGVPNRCAYSLRAWRHGE